MSNQTYVDTIDWNAFWQEADGDRRRSANVGQYGKADLMARFFDRVSTPAEFASFGCGPAACLFDLAERYPDVTFYGFDSAHSIIKQNRERATEDAIDNIAFEVTTLPDIDIDRAFDLVYCYATLHYVRDCDQAISNLYECVREGGHLVFNYPNTLSKTRMWREFGDNEQLRERFKLVFTGENLLSYRRIHEVLDRKPQSYWSKVDAPDEEWTGRDNPCVYLTKRSQTKP